VFCCKSNGEPLPGLQKLLTAAEQLPNAPGITIFSRSKLTTPPGRGLFTVRKPARSGAAGVPLLVPNKVNGRSLIFPVEGEVKMDWSVIGVEPETDIALALVVKHVLPGVKLMQPDARGNVITETKPPLLS